MDLVETVKSELIRALQEDCADFQAPQIDNAIYSLMLARLDPKKKIEEFKQNTRFICVMGSIGADQTLENAQHDVKDLIEISSEYQDSGRTLEKVVFGLNVIYDMFNDQNNLHYSVFNYLRAENTEARREKLKGFYNLCLLADIVHTSKKECDLGFGFVLKTEFNESEKITLVQNILEIAQKAGKYFLADSEPIVATLVLESFYELHTKGKLVELFADYDRFQEFGRQIEKYADRNRKSFDAFQSVLRAFVVDYAKTQSK